MKHPLLLCRVRRTTLRCGSLAVVTLALGCGSLAVVTLELGCGSLAPQGTFRLIDGKPQLSRFISPGAYQHYLEGELALLHGRPGDAVERLELALAHDPDAPYLHTRIAEILASEGKQAQALARLHQALQLNVRFPDALLLQGKLLWADRREKEAERSFRACIQANPELADCYLTYSSMLEQGGRATEAQSALQQMVDKTADKRQGHHRLALCCLRQVDYACAEKHLQASITDLAEAPLLLQLAHVQSARGEIDAAIRNLRRAFDRQGDELPLVARLMELLIHAGRIREVDDLLQVLQPSLEESEEKTATIAGILLELRRPDLALPLLERHPRISRAASLQVLRGAALALTDKKEEAKWLLRAQIGRASGADAALYLARYHWREGDYAAAKGTLTVALAAHSGDEQLILALSRTLHLLGEATSSISVVQKGLAASPRSRSLLFGLSLAMERVGRWRAAKKVMEELLADDPQDAAALNFIGFSLLIHSGDLRLAERHILKALLFDPGEAYILDSLGWLRFKQGRLAEAKRVLQIAVRLTPMESEVLGHLAEVHVALHETSSALQLLRAAVAYSVDKTISSQLARRLQELEKGRVGTR